MGRMGRATCIVHLISAPDRSGRKRMYHYIQEAKNFFFVSYSKPALAYLLLWYIWFLPFWSGAEINCTLHVALPKRAIKLGLEM